MTYTAQEIKEFCLTADAEEFKILAEIINEELELYSLEDLIIIMQASMILFTRSLIKHICK